MNQTTPEMAVSAMRCKEKPKYPIRAAELLKRCREWYGDAENEEAFRAWKDGRKKK